MRRGAAAGSSAGTRAADALEPDRPAHLLSRRRLLPALVREAAVLLGQLRGGQAVRVTDLAGLPDEQLAGLRPMVNPELDIQVEAGWIVGRHRGSGERVRLFPATDAERVGLLNRFDGQRTLAEIAQQRAQETACDPAHAFAQARELFLFLAVRLACVARSAPPGPE